MKLNTIKPVDIIVLSYNTLDYTKRCLRWMKLHTSYTNYRVFVLDNGSEDGSRKILPKLCLDLGFIFLQNEKNVGVSKGWNQVIEYISNKCGSLVDRYICLLNSDTLVAYGWLSALIQVMKVNDRCGIVGFGNCTNPNQNTLCAVSNLSFVSPLIRGEVFEKIGLFEERLFVYFQDNLFIDKAKGMGFKTFVTPENLVFHFGNASGSQLDSNIVTTDKQAYFKIQSEEEQRNLIKI